MQFFRSEFTYATIFQHKQGALIIEIAVDNLGWIISVGIYKSNYFFRQTDGLVIINLKIKNSLTNKNKNHINYINVNRFSFNSQKNCLIIN